MAKKLKQVKMTGKAFVKEHKELVKILKKPDKKGIKKEAKEQGEELERYLRNS